MMEPRADQIEKCHQAQWQLSSCLFSPKRLFKDSQSPGAKFPIRGRGEEPYTCKGRNLALLCCRDLFQPISFWMPVVRKFLHDRSGICMDSGLAKGSPNLNVAQATNPKLIIFNMDGREGCSIATNGNGRHLTGGSTMIEQSSSDTSSTARGGAGSFKKSTTYKSKQTCAYWNCLRTSPPRTRAFFVQYYSVLHNTTPYYTVLLRTTRYYSVLQSTPPYYTVLQCTTKHYSVLQSTAKYYCSTTLYYKVLLRTTVVLRTTKY